MSSSAIQVRPHPTKGRALYATQSFPSGAPIFPFTPTILLPSLSHLTSVCTHCLKPGSPRACSRCHAAAYCDAACQSAAWKAIHGKECKVLRGRPGLPTPVRAVVQALAKSEVGAALQGLEGHVEAWRGGDRWKDMEMMAMAASAFAGAGTGEGEVKKAVEILCKIQTNAFHRYDADIGQVGIFLEPTLAMVNHSCIPNAMVQFMGRRAILRAEMPIKAGDEIEISYTDYTYPLIKRREALSPYNFVCQCSRCENDLNVYQVCAMTPAPELNSMSLLADTSKIRYHPAATDNAKIARSKKYSRELVDLVDTKDMPESLGERRKVLRAQYQRCKGLVDDGLWALSPLPQILSEMSICYAEEGNYAYSLAVACHVATTCDPVRYVAPFHPVQAKSMFLIAKLLANTAADTASLSSSVQNIASKASLDGKVLRILQEIDQVSLCQMLLMMVLSTAPRGLADEWELAASAREILEDIGRLPGREKELSLIDMWTKDPRSDKSQAFFEYAVLKQVDVLASLGLNILEAGF